jgi:hypothetical protein
VPSVREIKCPVCGVENGPCVGGTGTAQYHTQRLLAANPTTYEHPECNECRKLKDAMVNAQMSFRSCRPDLGSYKSKSRWPKAWRDQHYQLEKASNLARAKYYLHLGKDHQDKNHQYDLAENALIVMREGRLKP